MFERFLCDFIYYQDHSIDITEVLATDLWEAYEWMGDAFLELHFDSTSTPDLLRLRKEDEVLAVWETHFDAVS